MMITYPLLTARINSALIEARARQFELDELEPAPAGGTRLMLSTRENGDSDTERAGSADIHSARRAVPLLTAAFPGCSVEIECVDEWVHLDVLITDELAPDAVALHAAEAFSPGP